MGTGLEWRSDRDWFDHTAGSEHPDALYRIQRAFDLVENSASVVCSTAHGFMFGSKMTEVTGKLTVGSLRWTHGSLRKQDSLGFFMTDDPRWSTVRPQRFDELLRPWAK